MQRQETDDALILTINIPKARRQRAGRAAGRTRAGRIKKSHAALDSGAAASYTLMYIYVERPPVQGGKGGHCMKTLILFASRYGATEEIAYMLKSAVGGDVTVCNVRDRSISLEGYDTVIIGSCVYMFKLDKHIKRFSAPQ